MNLKQIASLALDQVFTEDASFFDGVKHAMVEQPGRGKPKDTSLEKHDKKYHPDGYKEGDSCKFREDMGKKDDADKLGDKGGKDGKGKSVAERLTVDECDITKEKVDVIVNAAQKPMLGGGGVDGAIHRAAGPKLRELCAEYPPDKDGFRCLTGEAKITGGADLPAKHVIHTVGPDARLPEFQDLEVRRKALVDAYANSLKVAKENGLKTVSFPSISTGIFMYPLEEASKLAAKTIAEFLRDNPEMSVKMCIFDPDKERSKEIVKAYEDAFAEASNKVEGTAEDASPDNSQMTDLEKHDAKYHPNGYKDGDACKYRERLEAGDTPDIDIDAESSATPTHGEGTTLAQKASNTLTDIANELKDCVKKGADVSAKYLDEYEKAYDALVGNTSAGKSLKALAGKIGANGVMAGLLNKHMQGVQKQVSNTLPQGTKPPQEMRDEVARAIMEDVMKKLGAGLTISSPEVPEVPTASSAPAPTATATAAETPSQAPSPTPPAAPATPPAPPQYGPSATLDTSASTFPADTDFDFDNYGDYSYGWKSAGSGSTNPHTISINGETYYVKEAGNNSQYSNEAAQNEVNANNFLRLAGLNAPEAKLYKHNGKNYCVTKKVDHSGMLASNKINDPQFGDKLREAYPIMTLLYNTDIMLNDNAFVGNDGKPVYIDNGSTFGFSAQGKRDSKNKFGFDYDSRTEPDSTANPKSGLSALKDHSSQSAWNNLWKGKGQDDILKEVAKYDMGALAREAIARGYVPKDAEKAFQEYADNMDKMASAKYPNAKYTAATATANASSTAPATPTATATAPTSGFGATIQNLIAQIFPNSSFYNVISNSTFTPNQRGKGGTITLPRAIRVSRSAMNRINNAFAAQGLKAQLNRQGTQFTVRASNKSIANAALSQAGMAPSATPSAPAATTTP